MEGAGRGGGGGGGKKGGRGGGGGERKKGQSQSISLRRVDLHHRYHQGQMGGATRELHVAF